MEKQPVVRLMPLPVNVLVAVELFRIAPPVRVRPAEEERPEVERPPEKVEVAVSPTIVVVAVEPI